MYHLPWHIHLVKSSSKVSLCLWPSAASSSLSTAQIEFYLFFHFPHDNATLFLLLLVLALHTPCCYAHGMLSWSFCVIWRRHMGCNNADHHLWICCYYCCCCCCLMISTANCAVLFVPWRIEMMIMIKWWWAFFLPALPLKYTCISR